MKTEEVLEALSDLYGLTREPVALDAMNEIKSQQETIAKLAAVIMANTFLLESLCKDGRLTEDEFAKFNESSKAYLAGCGISDKRTVTRDMN